MFLLLTKEDAQHQRQWFLASLQFAGHLGPSYFLTRTVAVDNSSSRRTIFGRKQDNPTREEKTIACTKCDTLDWQAKSVLVVMCASEVVWHIQIQAKFSECLCRSACENIPHQWRKHDHCIRPIAEPSACSRPRGGVWPHRRGEHRQQSLVTVYLLPKRQH